MCLNTCYAKIKWFFLPVAKILKPTWAVGPIPGPTERELAPGTICKGTVHRNIGSIHVYVLVKCLSCIHTKYEEIVTETNQ